jgi:sugar phosphate isomerase/epimerase
MNRRMLMSRQANRRTFLGRAALASAAAASAFLGIFSAHDTLAIGPIKRRHGSKYRFTLAAYSYRHLLTGDKREYTLENFVDDCAEFGVEGTEPTSYYFPQPVTDEYLCGLKAHAFRLGLSISSTAVGNNFCLPPGARRDKEIAHVKQWIEHAQVLGAHVVRIFSGSVGKQQSADEAHRLVVEGIEECCRHAAKKGIFLGLENHGGLTSTADRMLAIIQEVKSPWFGAWMDTGNFHGQDIYGELNKIAPYTIHVQVKVVTSSRGHGQRPTDFRRLARILDGVGYRGWICLEYEEDEDPRIACPRYIEQLRNAFTA